MTRDDFLHELKNIQQIDMALREIEKKKTARINDLLEKCLELFKNEEVDDVKLDKDI